MPNNVRAVDHVQLPMPLGASLQARRFYAEVLELQELRGPAFERPGTLHFSLGWQRLDLTEGHYIGIAPQAHLALQVIDLERLALRLHRAGHLVDDAPLLAEHRFYVEDPFGNRLELIEPAPASSLQSLSNFNVAV